jgi:hypothetical protein
MAVVNFIQTIWSKSIQDDLETQCKLVPNCLTKYEGDCKQASTVKILGVGEPTIVDYQRNKGYAPEYMSDVGQELVIDQAKAFFFYVDDIDEAQSVPGLREEYQRKATHKLAVAADTYVGQLIKGAENSTTAEDNTGDGIKNAIDEGLVELRERDFDEEGVIEIAPFVYSKFKNHLITLSTNNPEYIKKGIVGMYDGFEVVMSNNLAKDATHAYCDIRGKKAIAFAGQINEVEALRAHDRFADVVRGLYCFGAKIIDKDRIQGIKVPLAA